MFDLGWGEMLLVGVVALIVVGPKELPGLFRSIGFAVGKARGLAREFSRAMEAAADESGMKEIDRTIRAATKPVQFATDRLRETATPPRPASAIPPAGTPLNPGEPIATGTAPVAVAAGPVAGPVPGPVPVPAPAAPPGPATQALIERRAEERAARLEAAPAPASAPTDEAV